MADCGCGCSDSITITEGEQGNDGTSTVLSTSALSTTAAVHSLYTANRASTASTALDYDWSVITIPAIAASNIAIFDAMFVVTATGAHTITVTVLETGSGAPVSGISYAQVCDTSETINVRFQIANVTEGQIYAIHLATSDPTVTATLTGGNCQIDLYA